MYKTCAIILVWLFMSKVNAAITLAWIDDVPSSQIFVPNSLYFTQWTCTSPKKKKEHGRPMEHSFLLCSSTYKDNK